MPRIQERRISDGIGTSMDSSTTPKTAKPHRQPAWSAALSMQRGNRERRGPGRRALKPNG